MKGGTIEAVLNQLRKCNSRAELDGLRTQARMVVERMEELSVERLGRDLSCGEHMQAVVYCCAEMLLSAAREFTQWNREQDSATESSSVTSEESRAIIMAHAVMGSSIKVVRDYVFEALES